VVRLLVVLTFPGIILKFSKFESMKGFEGVNGFLADVVIHKTNVTQPGQTFIFTAFRSL